MKKNNVKAITMLKDLIERVEKAKIYPAKPYKEDLIEILNELEGKNKETKNVK